VADLSLAIVTSCGNGYGQYLAEWAESIVGLTRKPTMVGIVTHGSDADRDAGLAAAEQLEAAGIPVRRVHEYAEMNLGAARNAAVRLTDTEWVMHLDADDMVMPHCLEDVAALAPTADVIPLGYVRMGDIAAGPRLKSKLYRSSAGPSTLTNATPSSGVSPFRRSFWEQAPYREDLRAGGGGWDTALWLGFAHLGARFVPTSRHCFWYRQHADSLFNVRRGSGWPQERMGQKLQGFRRGDHGVSIIVPRAVDDGPERIAAWAWLKARYQTLFPDWQLLEGRSHAAMWRKGEAVDNALTRATGSVLVIADADCVVPEAALREAVALVESGVPWVVPHRTVSRLNPRQTAEWLADPVSTERPPPTGDLFRPAYTGVAGGGIVVIERSDFAAVGGIPKTFCGWGAEDESLALILDTMLGPHRRLDTPLVHLWHPPAPKNVSNHRNRPLFEYFRRASGDQAMMWALIRPDRPPSTGAPIVGGAFGTAARYETLARLQLVREPSEATEARMIRHTVERAQRTGSVARYHEVAAAKAAERARVRQEALTRRQRKADFRPLPNKMLIEPLENKSAAGAG
jgi:hypothetical protein